MVVFGANFPEGCEGAFKRPCFHMFSVNEQKGSVEKDGKKHSLTVNLQPESQHL